MSSSKRITLSPSNNYLMSFNSTLYQTPIIIYGRNSDNKSDNKNEKK